MRTSLAMYLAIAQLAMVPVASLFWPGLRQRYLRTPRWLLTQIAITLLAFVVLAVLPR